jgi:dipeptidyl aminopeptidase/acylaminoacyl peptidase
MFFPALRNSIAAAALVLCTLSVAAQTTPNSRTVAAQQAPRHARAIAEVAVSPDGKRLAWIEGMRRTGGEIHIAPIDNLAKASTVTAAAPASHCRESNFVWSPDSKILAFFSDCADPGGQTDLYIDSFDGKAPRRLTELEGYVDAPAFSPDGSLIAFLYVQGATRAAGALAAMKPPSGVIGEDGVEIQRVAVIPTSASKPLPPAFATPEDLYVYEFDWSPDSKSLAYVAADPPGENNWWVAKLYTQSLTTKPGAPEHDSVTWEAKPKVVLSPSEVQGPLHGLQIAVPRWSPDGKTIAFIGGLMSDQGVTGGDIWIVSSAGGEPRDLTPNRLSTPEWVEWDSNRSLYATELAGGETRLIRLNPQENQSSNAESDVPPVRLPGSIGGSHEEMSLSSTADHSLFVFAASSFDLPPEIYIIRPGSTLANNGVTQISHFNDGLAPSAGKTISINWVNEGFHVQGWLMFPKDFDPANRHAGRYPLVVEVHGGPAAAVVSRWDGGAGGISTTNLSDHGYFVLMPNPRGSFGQGEAFTQANRKDFGYGDLRDILAGVDTVLAQYPIDPNRVGIDGWSYGGFMTMFAVTQTNRFKAAVAGAGISDWLSYYGENSIDQWMIPYFGASVYDDPAVYAKSSAITFIKQAHTPTLTVVGDRDGECPAPQSYEFWHALRDQHVPAQLVVYPDEGHGFVNPAHTRDVNERAVDWFDRYMPAAP